MLEGNVHVSIDAAELTCPCYTRQLPSFLPLEKWGDGENLPRYSTPLLSLTTMGPPMIELRKVEGSLEGAAASAGGVVGSIVVLLVVVDASW